ncbi:MAG: hypothetical protein JXA00_01720 [Candidatus Thermoplasmatota archaeon]|nr:hypothetical protein [Candidatus Thermoplasmatota archaeon]
MQAHPALRALLLTFILTVGSLATVLFTPPASAQDSQGETTLYFTNFDSENYTDLGFTSLSLTPPTKDNDSEYPPDLVQSGLQLNTDQYLTWFFAWLLYFLGESEEFNLSDLFDIFGDDTLEGYDFEVLFPHPFRIVEGYTYEGDDAVTITGDVSYNLFFHSYQKLLPKFRDDVKIGLYSMDSNSYFPLPKIIKSTNVTLSPELLKKTYNEQLTLSNISYTLQPGESLLFTIEIIPTNKTIGNLAPYIINIDRFLNRWQRRANNLENSSKPLLQQFGTIIQEILYTLSEIGTNITMDDFNTFFDTFRSTSFIYDSTSHPASVSIPANIRTEDIHVYYLHDNQVIDENKPDTDNTLTLALKEDTPVIWTTDTTLSRNKVLKVDQVSADLYLNHRDLHLFHILKKKISITATLYDDAIPVKTSVIELDKTKLFELFSKPSTPVTFTFNGSDIELTYGHTLGLGVALTNGTKLGIRTVKLLYDSVNFPTSLRVTFEETTNIQIKGITSAPTDGEITPGQTIQFLLNVSSKYDDTLQITTAEKDKEGSWDVSAPSSTTVTANTNTQIQVSVTSTNPYKEAYGDTIELLLTITGTTGIDKQTLTAEVTQDAIIYDVDILGYTKDININKGENRTFFFVIKNNNTGALDDVDSYTITAVSEHDWPLIPREHIRDLQNGESTETEVARVVIQAPKDTTIASDTITITVTSDADPSTSASITITAHVIGGGVFEGFVDFFNAAADSLGLNEIFGEYGGLALFSLLIVIILFILIILAFVLTTKSVRLICTDRIKEIEPTEEAVFDLTVKNPFKKPATYELSAEQTALGSHWTITIDAPQLTLNGRQSHTVHLTATPTEEASEKDWTKITVNVKKAGKTRAEQVTLMVMLKEGTTLLQLGDVTHSPSEFSPGERIISSFSVSNKGSVSARNVTVFFYLNGKQHHKLTVTIPAGSIADIQVPWIAVKGKNKVRIRLKEES